MPAMTKLEEDALTGLESAVVRAETEPAVRHSPGLGSGRQPILSIRATVDKADAGAFIAEALRDIRVYMQEHRVSPAGRPFSICRQRGSSVDVEAGWPTAKLLTGTTRIHCGELLGPVAGLGLGRRRAEG
jgi:hypothetical protein